MPPGGRDTASPGVSHGITASPGEGARHRGEEELREGVGIIDGKGVGGWELWRVEGA